MANGAGGCLTVLLSPGAPFEESILALQGNDVRTECRCDAPTSASAADRYVATPTRYENPKSVRLVK